MNNRQIFLGALAAVFAAMPAHGAPLPVTKRTIADKSKFYEINIECPQTGVKVIDDDLVKSAEEDADQFRREAKSTYRASDGPDTLDMTYTVVRNDASVLAVMFDVDTDFHGAHPNQDIWTANYARADGWRIYLPELFDGPRALPKISQLAIADLDRRIASGADAMTDKDWVARGAGPTGSNFAAFVLLPNAIHIWFPPYQVAAYAAGPQEVEIPLAPLKLYYRSNPRAPAASFDCRKAAHADEAAICSDVDLARLDRAAAEAYANALDASNNDQEKNAKRAAQRAWLAHRSDSCGGAAGAPLVACLKGVYKARIAALAPE